MLAELKAARGPAFNPTYISQQKAAHQQAPALQSGYANSGDDPNLKAAAAQIAPVVQMHIDVLSKM
jgi:putative membrane protein